MTSDYEEESVTPEYVTRSGGPDAIIVTIGLSGPTVATIIRHDHLGRDDWATFKRWLDDATRTPYVLDTDNEGV